MMSISGELREIGKQINSLQTKALQLAVAHVDEVGFEYTVSYVKNDGTTHYSYHPDIEEAVAKMESFTDVDWMGGGVTVVKQVKWRVC
jgi:hypothetical protein